MGSWILPALAAAVIVARRQGWPAQYEAAQRCQDAVTRQVTHRKGSY